MVPSSSADDVGVETWLLLGPACGGVTGVVAFGVTGFGGVREEDGIFREDEGEEVLAIKDVLDGLGLLDFSIEVLGAARRVPDE